MIEIENDNFSITKSNYFVEIISKTLTKDWWKERINKRIASKSLFCKECKELINAGELYIRDKFWYSNAFGYDKIKTNFICLECWEGELPPKVSNNWVK